ncbi:MAG: GNAT family N-acetyltransferase [Chloroflexota bacterium]|nr:GNAT family N-acetyltransferase [Chloroflexota bacterium]
MDDPFLAPTDLITDRFHVRPYRAGDGPLLNEAVRHSYEHLRTFMSWAMPDTTPAESERLVRTFCGRYWLDQDFGMGIFHPAGHRQLGGTGYHLRQGALSNGSAEIGMWIRADAAGQGLGTAVLQALLEWGFTAWSWERLIWRCDTRNTASAHTAARAGMQLEGCERRGLLDGSGTRHDCQVYAALKGEWAAPGAPRPA